MGEHREEGGESEKSWGNVQTRGKERGEEKQARREIVAREKERIGANQVDSGKEKERGSRQERSEEGREKNTDAQQHIGKGIMKGSSGGLEEREKGNREGEGEESRRKEKYKGKGEIGTSIRNRIEEEERKRNNIVNNNYRSRQNNIEREAQERGERGRRDSEKTSDSSEIELIDRHKLDRCMVEKWERERKRRTSEGEGRVDDMGGKNVGVGAITRSNREEGNGILGKNRDREREIVKEKGVEYRQSLDRSSLDIKEWMLNRSNSEITTSSIAALFIDKQLEREGKRIGRKQITRRKVWERWKGIVRGEIRRGIKKKIKMQRNEEKEKQDSQLVFDYTTKGLTVEEMKLLGRGEGFCVADYKIDEDKTKVDIYHFQRRLRLHEMFREANREEEDVELDIETLGTVAQLEGRGEGQSRRSIIGREPVQSTRGTVIGRERASTPARREFRVSNMGRGSNITARGGVRLSNVGRGSRVTYRDSSEREERVGVDRSTPMTIRGRARRESRLSVLERGTLESRHSREGRGNRTNRVETSRGGRQEADGRRRTVGGENRESGIDMGRENRLSTIGRGSISRRESITSRNEREREIEQRQKGRRVPSMYDPESQNRSLNRYNTCIQEEILLGMEEKKMKFRDNISKEERIALKALKKRIEEKEIIITRADKGSGLVAIDYETYVKKGTKYIEEEVGAYNRVQESQQSIINRVIKERNKIAEQMKEKGVIMVQTATYIKKQLEEKIIGIKFYYKIHKDKNIDTMPLRPLQSCIKAPIQHLSIVLTDILQPLLTDKNIPTFIFDSNQLLYRLHKLGNIPENCTLVSSDVFCYH